MATFAGRYRHAKLPVQPPAVDRPPQVGEMDLAIGRTTWPENLLIVDRLCNNNTVSLRLRQSRLRREMTPPYTKMNRQMIAERVRENRERADLTMRELAQAAGVSVGCVHRIEHAKGSPRLATLERLAAGLDVPLADLLEDR